MAKYYTMSDCALKCRTITQFFAALISKGSKIKLALDNQSVLTKKYIEVIDATYKHDDHIGYSIRGMLGLIIYPAESYAEYFDIDKNSSDPFMDVCCQTIDKCLVVGSKNKCRWSQGISPQGLYTFNSQKITIIEPDDAPDISSSYIICEQANIASGDNSTITAPKNKQIKK